MKRILPLLIFSILFTVVQNASAQAQSGSTIRKIIDATAFAKYPALQSTEMAYNEQTKVLTCTGHVSFRTDRLEITDAEKVTYDEKAKKLVIYACRRFTFGGKVVIKDQTSKVNTVEYTIGEDVLYVL